MHSATRTRLMLGSSNVTWPGNQLQHWEHRGGFQILFGFGTVSVYSCFVSEGSAFSGHNFTPIVQQISMGFIVLFCSHEKDTSFVIVGISRHGGSANQERSLEMGSASGAGPIRSSAPVCGASKWDRSSIYSSSSTTELEDNQKVQQSWACAHLHTALWKFRKTIAYKTRPAYAIPYRDATDEMRGFRCVLEARKYSHYVEDVGFSFMLLWYAAQDTPCLPLWIWGQPVTSPARAVGEVSQKWELWKACES